MKRLSLTLVLAIMVASAGFTGVAAQPAMDSGLTLDNIILRVTGDGMWTEAMNIDGTAGSFESAQVLDGVPQFDLQPTTAALYEKHQVQHVYVYASSFDRVPANLEEASTGIEVRLLVFPAEANASAYLEEAYQGQVDAEANGEVVNTQFAPIDPLPAFANPSVGWTFAIDYYDVETGEFVGYASSARYMSQVGRVVVSARASGPLVDLNFDLAYGLLNRQVECMAQSMPCEAVAMADVAAPGWNFDTGELGFTDAAGNWTPARVLYPIDEPVRAPEVSSAIATPTALGTDATARRLRVG